MRRIASVRLENANLYRASRIPEALRRRVSASSFLPCETSSHVPKCGGGNGRQGIAYEFEPSSPFSILSTLQMDPLAFGPNSTEEFYKRPPQTMQLHSPPKTPHNTYEGKDSSHDDSDIIGKEALLTCANSTCALLSRLDASSRWSGPRTFSWISIALRYNKSAPSCLPCDPSAAMTKHAMVERSPSVHLNLRSLRVRDSSTTPRHLGPPGLLFNVSQHYCSIPNSAWCESTKYSGTTSRLLG